MRDAIARNAMLSYDDVQKAIKGTRHLLLGNGFSIACDPIYAYPNLYEAARPTFNERIQRAFEHLGTNNFEGVMRLLHDAGWLVREYGALAASDDMQADLTIVKNALVEAVANNHLQRPSEVGDDKLARCVTFLLPYQNVFTVCYDLLLYWVAMHGLDLLKERDGFRDSLDDEDADYCVFREHIAAERGILFIHGALHLYASEREVRKHTWTKSGVPLIDGITNAFAQGQLPLFVAEGDPDKKREQILHNGYLDYCFGKFSRVASPLVTFGFSFGATDRHITKAIAQCGKVTDLFVGVHKPDADVGKATMAAASQVEIERKNLLAHGLAGKPLAVHFYDSSTAPVW